MLRASKGKRIIAALALIFSGCATSSPTNIDVPLSECRVTWDTTLLPAGIHQKCQRTITPGGGVDIYGAIAESGSFAGLAMIIETTAPQRVEPEEFERVMEEKWMDAFESDHIGPSKSMMTPWGEKAEVKKVRVRIGEGLKDCITWSSKTIQRDKITPEGMWVSGKVGIICNEEPYEFLGAVKYE